MQKEKFTSASKTQPTLPVGPHAMQEGRFMAMSIILWTSGHACKSANQNSHYFYPSTWMVSPGVEEWKELTPSSSHPQRAHESHLSLRTS